MLQLLHAQVPAFERQFLILLQLLDGFKMTSWFWYFEDLPVIWFWSETACDTQISSGGGRLINGRGPPSRGSVRKRAETLGGSSSEDL